MPGLINRHTRTIIPLQGIRVSSCVNGQSLATTSALTYYNDEDHVVEGFFVLPLDEASSLVGFEAHLQTRNITVQLKDKTDIDHFNEQLSGGSQTYLGQGKFSLTETEEQTIFCANIGTIRPFGSVTLLLSLVSELQTNLEGGVVVKYPCVLTPRLQTDFRNFSTKDSDYHSVTNEDCHEHQSTEDLLSETTFKKLSQIANETPYNPMEYNFEFQLEVKAPTLLAGVWSSSHSIRVDADPFAKDASSVFVTLAEPHSMDRDLEIMVFRKNTSEPVVILEHGNMRPEEYEAYVKSETEFIRDADLGDENERNVCYIKNRLHKDIMHVPVIMLNYFPNYEEFKKKLLRDEFEVPGEFVFMVNRNSSMCGDTIANTRESLLLCIKSLPFSCRFNVIGFGSTCKPAFEQSRPYTQANVEEASNHIRTIRADLGGNNSDLLSALSWVYEHPVARGWPRQVFIITDGSISNTGQTIELIRANRNTTRVHVIGVGYRSSTIQLETMANVGRGSAVMINTGDRMHKEVADLLKRSLRPCISDITFQWSLPYGIELCQTPTHHPPLMQGESIVVYGLLTDTAGMKTTVGSFLKEERHNPFLDKNLSDDHSVDLEEEKHSSFSPQQDSQSSNRSFIGSASPVRTLSSSPRSDSRMEQEVNDPLSKNTSNEDYMKHRRIELLSRRVRASSLSEATDAVDPGTLRTMLSRLSYRDRRKSSSPTHVARSRPKSETDRRPPKLCFLKQEEQLSIELGPMSPVWDNFIEGGRNDFNFGVDLEKGLDESWILDGDNLIDIKARSTMCSLMISGLFCGQSIECHVPFDIRKLLTRGPRIHTEEEDVWEETIHQLAAKNLVQDLELLEMQAIRDEVSRTSLSDMPSDEAFKLHTKVVDVSQSANVISKHTAFISIDQETDEPLPCLVQVQPNSKAVKQCTTRRHSNHQSYSSGFGGKFSNSFTESEDDAFSSGYGRPPSPVGSTISEPVRWNGAYVSQKGRIYDLTSNSKSLYKPISSINIPIPRPKFANIGAKLGKIRRRLGTPTKRPIFANIQNTRARTASLECVELFSIVEQQLACGAWNLNIHLADIMEIPLEKLRNASPLCMVDSRLECQCTRDSFVKDGSDLHDSVFGSEIRTSDSGYRSFLSADTSPDLQTNSSLLLSTGIPSRSSAAPLTDSRSPNTNTWESGGVFTPDVDLEQRLWGTALAIIWLHHSCSNLKAEWDLICCKAHRWLGNQRLPMGYDVPGLKAAAYQVYLLLKR
ncbi:von Willebrand factor A domain-containing protein 5B1-like isoform X2 [Anneissia japonica]|uniref:von Willebrand factor A domain-containing protein 5B1-like isoform X2 n=1 Tax=Anneissia japonica TaxID=1529436 RepID=UPI00142561E1|nr:von Willebrand factor A domain-containing protein 5B1-like isoform X2 [Anneissia japonica]